MLVLWFSRGLFDCVGERGAAKFWEDAEKGGALLQDVRLPSGHWSSAS